jgi:hypothetical protein
MSRNDNDSEYVFWYGSNLPVSHGYASELCQYNDIGVFKLTVKFELDFPRPPPFHPNIIRLILEAVSCMNTVDK